MSPKFRLVKLMMFIGLAILAGTPLYALPAMVTLRPGTRPGVQRLSIAEAAIMLRSSGKTGWQLVEAARALVGQRMQYCRRNSFETAAMAFERGYGYCMQHGYALVELLSMLGFEARVVQAFQNQFPDGSIGSHAWVRVNLNGAIRDIDPLFYDAEVGKIKFIPLSTVTEISPLFKLLTWWGAPAVNAHRYYVTGKDQ